MPKIIIFANGIPPKDLDRHRKLIGPGDTIICADGGTLHALALGLTPDLIVGDLDSLPDSIRATMIEKGVEIQQHPTGKDQTDLELALSVAVERGADEILLLTALGGRLDQQLANILLLTRSDWAAVRLWLVDGNHWAAILRGPDQLTLSGHAGDTLSFVPLSPVVEGLDIANVAWPLTNKTVHLGSTLTISNAFLAEEATIAIRAGVGLVIHIQEIAQD